MKKKTALLIAVTCMILTFCMSSLASTVTRSIPSVRININTSGMDFRDNYDDSPDGYVSVPDNQYYELDSCEWVDDVSTLKPGATPRIKVRLEAYPKEISHSNYDQIYLFR